MLYICIGLNQDITVNMLCNHCKREFDDKLAIPRLLIVCGHSLCESCCYRLHVKERVECPECHSSTFVDSISLLPKNLALISSPSGHDLCQKHHKKYEAFCEKQNMLICIECILQDGHKSHEMDSIHNCYEKHSTLWSKKLSKLKKHQQKITDLLSETKKSYEDYQDNYGTLKENVQSFFRELREAVEREEENVLTKLKETYNQVQRKFQDKIQGISLSIDTLTTLNSQLEGYREFNQVEFLQSHAEREQHYNSVSQNNEEGVKVTPLNFSKKVSTDALSKTFQALIGEKTQKKQSSAIGTSNYNSVTAQVKKVDPGTAIKAVRKMPNSPQSTPPASIVSSQNRKKVSSKKDIHASVAPQSQACIVISKITPSKETRQKPQLICSQLAQQIHNDISGVDPKESLCHSFISNMTSFLSDRKSIYLIGGFNEQANNIVKLNLFNFNWEDICNLPSNRSKFGCVAVDRSIYLFGGKKGKERVGDSEVFSLTANKWNRSNQISKKRSGFSIICLGDLLYFIGGNDGDNILNTVQTLNIVTGEWKKKESLHEPRDQLSAVIGKNNKIYAIGGFGGKDNQPLKSVEVFDPKTEKWKVIPSMNEPRRALAAAVLADGIYAIGGFDGSMYLNSVEKYEQGDKQWTYVSAMNQSRCTHSAVSIYESQQIYVFGGFDYIPLDSVQRYNVITNEWESICKMPTARFMHSSLLLKED